MSMLNLIDQVFPLRLTIALLHFLWQGALIAVGAAGASWLLRRGSANSRYAVYVTAFGLMPVCVAATFAWVDVPTPAPAEESHPAAAANNAAAAVLQVDEPAIDQEFSAELPDVATVPPATAGGEVSPPSTAGDPGRARKSEPVAAETEPIATSRAYSVLVRSAPYVTGVYLAGVLLLLMRLVRGAWGTRRLRRAATEVADAELLAWVRGQAEQLGMRTVPALRRCAAISVPAVIGVLRPVILLPATAATGLSMDQLRAIIAHELAHVRRYDLVVNLLQRVIETLLFFHPAVWWLSRRISAEREEACDELVLSAGYERTQYADALVRMAEISRDQRGRRRAAPATALAADGAAPTEFKRRILKILGVREPSHMRPGRAALFSAVTAALLAVVAPAVWVHLDRTAKADPAQPAKKAQPAKETENSVRKSSDPPKNVLDHTTLGNGVTLAFSPEGGRLAVMNGNPTRTMYRDGRGVAKGWKPTVDIIDTDTLKVAASLDLSKLPHDPDWPVEQGPTFVEATAMAFSPDGATLAVGTSVGQLMLFNAKTGALVKSLDDKQGRLAEEKTPDFWKQRPRVMGHVKSVSFSSDGKQLAVCGKSFADWTATLDRVLRTRIRRTAPGRLKVFDVKTGKLKFNPAAHSDMAVDVAYSPDGKFLASAGRWMDGLKTGQFGDGVILWDAKTGERLARVDLDLRGWMYDVAFSPDGKRILLGAQDFDSGGGNGKGVVAMLAAETLAVVWKRNVTRSAMRVASYPQEDAVIVLTNRQDLSYFEAGSGKTLLVRSVADSEPPKKQRCVDFAISPQGHLTATAVVENRKGRIKFIGSGKRDPDADGANNSGTDPGEVSAERVAPQPKTGNSVSEPVGMNLKLIKSGSFLMGSRADEEDAEDDEKPQHRVRISRDFYIGETEVTQQQWKAVMGTTPWKGKQYVKERPNYPATHVTWKDAVAFCERLSAMEGVTYRLPTEAEWEYACRAGTTTRFSFGDDAAKLADYAWFGFLRDGRENDEPYAHEVGIKRPNPWGLYDMHGNVSEYCGDWYAEYDGEAAVDPLPNDPTRGSLRVMRGGHWIRSPEWCRSSARAPIGMSSTSSLWGFRVVRVPAAGENADETGSSPQTSNSPPSSL